MDTLSLGKLLPDIKVSLENDGTQTDSFNILKNETVSSNVEIARPSFESELQPRVYKNPDGGFATGLDLLSQENSGILDKRAERFGLEQKSSLNSRVKALYESMGMDLQNRNSGFMKNVRLDALHIRGVDNLNSDDLFEYFQDYGPHHIEWINDSCCNILWKDESGCARALLGMSKELPALKSSNIGAVDDTDINKESENVSLVRMGHKQKTEKMEIDDPEQQLQAKEIVSVDIPVPPGVWRLGNPHDKARTILLRFATKDDKKLPGAEKRSNYYKKHGNPNYGGLTGVISSSKKQKAQSIFTRKALNIEPDSTKIQSAEAKSSRKRPLRMRMYADDEEEERKRKRSEKLLASHYGEKSSVHSRLGKKYTKEDLHNLGYKKEYRNFDYSSHFRDDKSRTKDGDLRSKLTSMKSAVHVEDNGVSSKHHESAVYVKDNGVSRAGKLEKRKYFKRRYRSPLCRDEDEDDDDDSDESSSDY